jgi:uncharacterized protein (DUF433 family)
MPVYACYRGDCDHLALQAEGPSAFVAKDAFGHDWLCVETGLAEIPGGVPESVWEMLEAQARAHKLGLSRQGSRVAMYDRPDMEGLRHAHVLATYPPAEESAVRLRQAGFTLLQETWGTGKPHRLLLGAIATFRFEGETEAEAWYRAAQALLGQPSAGTEGQKMTLTIREAPAPLRTDEGGAVRVGKTRIRLGTVVRMHEGGATPEAIVRAYPTLSLADVYAAVAYYLANKEEVSAYLQAREVEADRLQAEIEEAQSTAGLKEKLLAMRAQREQGHASARQ